MNRPEFYSDVPTRLASEVSEDERNQLREEFDRTLSSWRLRRSVAVVVGFAAVLVSWFADRLLPDYQHALFMAMLMVLFVAIAIANIMPRCPLCEHRLSGRLGRYCPDCGAAGLARVRFGVPHCNACGKSISGAKGRRRYKVRTCTSCGLVLDQAGL